MAWELHFNAERQGHDGPHLNPKTSTPKPTGIPFLDEIPGHRVAAPEVQTAIHKALNPNVDAYSEMVGYLAAHAMYTKGNDHNLAVNVRADLVKAIRVYRDMESLTNQASPPVQEWEA